ncbi:MAG: hypothetical protein A2Y92_04105 [Chloroflexi bacterium RBG_13_57_8]|nr:MAG: hypothetical protein A2Y92_04105 [Chloroflexi bacterium RBG_13_57_8]
MKITFLPKTLPGKWSLGLTGASIILFVFLIIMGATGQEGGETFFDNLLLAIPGLLALVSGVAAFFTGVISIAFVKERAILVFLTTLFGLLVLFFFLGDLIVPH